MRRIELAGGIHHVTTKAPSRRVLFRADEDRVEYLRLLAAEAAGRRWEILTYCQMTNHAHLLVRTPEADLGVGMKRIHEVFAMRFNRRHAEWGALFGARFGNKLVLTERHFFGCMRYIARNPVEAGMVSHAAAWPWSAHASLAGLRPPEPFIDVERTFAMWSGSAGDARRSYTGMVARSDGEMLAELRQHGPEWPALAVDQYGIPVAEVGRFLGLGRTQTYDRIATARRTERSDLSVRFSGG